MAETVRIPLEEFSRHPRTILLRVVREGQVVIVDAGNEGVITLRSGEPDDVPELPAGKTEDDYRAFLDSFGSWREVDTERLLDDIRASRSISRSPVDL